MSHSKVVYPFFNHGRTDAAPSLVGEQGAEYVSFRKSFLDYVELLDNALPKARAIAWLIHEGNISHEETIKEASLAIVDYIDEVLVAHRDLYEKYTQTRDHER
jgi:hypothetical protein